MTKLKEAASLTSALLAKKGRAAPSEYMPSAPAAADSDSDDFVSSVKPLKDFNAVKSIANKPADELTIDHGSGRVRLSLRLDPKRHMALQNTATHLEKSSQQIITEALDNYLNLALSILSRKSPHQGNQRGGTGTADQGNPEWRTKASQAKRLAARRLADKKSQAGSANKARS